MNEYADLLERLESLESKVAFQDDTIDQLNQVIVNLNEEIRQLRMELIGMAEKMLEGGEASTDPNQVEIPPHY